MDSLKDKSVSPCIVTPYLSSGSNEIFIKKSICPLWGMRGEGESQSEHVPYKFDFFTSSLTC